MQVKSRDGNLKVDVEASAKMDAKAEAEERKKKSLWPGMLTGEGAKGLSCLCPWRPVAIMLPGFQELDN